jgi:predicted nucleic acid-binding protein
LPEVICNTSPLQYLHQLDLLELLPKLVGRVTIPSAVVAELDAGRKCGVNLPDLSRLDWVDVCHPTSEQVLPLVVDLGLGETEVLALALEHRGAIVILDDCLARQVALTLHIPLTGTLGVLLSAKRASLIPAVAPCLDQLQNFRFRLAPATRNAVLKLAGELP